MGAPAPTTPEHDPYANFIKDPRGNWVPYTIAVPDITGYDSVRDVYIDRRGHAYKVNRDYETVTLWYDMGVASDYYTALASQPPIYPAPKTTGTTAIVMLAAIAALFSMG